MPTIQDLNSEPDSRIELNRRVPLNIQQFVPILGGGMVNFENQQTRKSMHGTYFKLSPGHYDTCGTLGNGPRHEFYLVSVHIFFSLAILALFGTLAPGKRQRGAGRGAARRARSPPSAEKASRLRYQRGRWRSAGSTSARTPRKRGPAPRALRYVATKHTLIVPDTSTDSVTAQNDRTNLMSNHEL